MAKGSIAQSKIDVLTSKRVRLYETLRSLVEAANDPYGIEVGVTSRIAILRARILEIDGFLELIAPKEKEPDHANPQLDISDGELQPYVEGGPIPDGGDLPPTEPSL